MEFSTSKIRKRTKEKLGIVQRDSIGAELHHLDEDKSITTDDPGENSKRRTLRLTKKENSWGFTLQTYGIKHKKTNEVEILTYVDYIEINSPAWYAGLRKGDVILSVNGERVGNSTHDQLVNTIRKAGNTLRMVVLFEDCCRKVELHERYMKLKAVLQSKYEELKAIERQEREIITNYCEAKGLNRFDMVRQSVLSTISSSSDSWDAYSTISSPTGTMPTGHFANKNWYSMQSLKSYSMGDNSSMLDDGYSFIDSESDSDGVSINCSLSANIHGSDSNLVTKFVKDSNLMRVREAKHDRLARSSDSHLYRRSWSPMQSQRLTQNKLMKSEESVPDDVFLEEESFENVSLPRNISSISAKQNKVFYAGENGNIIIPKICIEGNQMFTTFQEVNTHVTDVPKVDPETYQDNIVAIEIAKEMARLEKTIGEEQKPVDTERSRKDAFSKSLDPSYASRNGRGSPVGRSYSPLAGRNSPGEGYDAKTDGQLDEKKFDSNGAKSKYSTVPNSESYFDLQKGQLCTYDHKNIGGSMTYEQLKSSVPDIQVSFHSEKYQLIYINEKSETTKL